MRIQVLHLPDDVADGHDVPRFALVLDEYGEGLAAEATDSEADKAAERFRAFALHCGAQDGLVVDRRVEIVESTMPAEFITDVVTQLDQVIGNRLNEHVAARDQVTHHFSQPATVTNGTFLQQWTAAERRHAQVR
ncbi:hypothetical protein ACIBTV_27295 [Micromonospora sp. NPDC049366]|uniref:hypothetical protein n=1 Tax=Micromonospora sp. NPDC049366 TaxID=3364271 RepID=UPI003794E2E4